MKLIIILLISVTYANGLKILGVLPLASKSHFSIGKGILDALYDAGHDITVISPFSLKTPKERYRDIDMSDILEMAEKNNKKINGLELGKLPVLGMIPFLPNMGTEIVDSVMTHPNVLKFMDSKEQFDVCIIELFYTDAMSGIADHVNCIFISYTTFNAVGLIDEITGNISPNSYVPMPFLDYTDKMTFIERLWNTIYTNYEKIIYHLTQFPGQQRLYNKHFPNAKKPFDKMIKSSAIIFQNSHVSFATPRPYLPNVIEICGIHVKPAKPLSSDLQKFLDSAHDGVILFSMGSFIQSKDFPVEKRQAFVNVFKKLKQKVVWKFEEELPEKPDNIRTEKWMPQRDILAHKNVVLFITHGGLLGTTEAMYEGVPVLGIPIFGDQKMNMAKAVTKNYGLILNYNEISEDTVSQALNEMLNNPKYRDTAKLLSERFKDRPMTPQESVVYWTEFAHRHNGAEHLRSAAIDMSYLELMSIDVYAVLLIVFMILIYVSYCVVRFMLRKFISMFTAKQKVN